MSDKARSRQGYLSYERMLDRIEKGELDAYDLNFTPDTHECYVIDPNLKPWPIQSKVCIFNSVAEGVEQINESSYSYAGQIVAVLIDGHYQGFMVNGNKGNFTLSSLADPNVNIDYDNLNKHPIINKVGTLSSPIIADELDDGIYTFNGQYKISSKLDTVFNGSLSQLFLIETIDGIKYIRKLSNKEIITYSIGDTVEKDSVVTADFLKENEYATKEDINQAVQALDIFTKKDAENYITHYLADSQAIKDAVSEELNNRIVEITASDIDRLFS